MKATERRENRKGGRTRRRSEVEEGMMEMQEAHEHTRFPTGRDLLKNNRLFLTVDSLFKAKRIEI